MQLSGDDHTLLETLKTEIANVNATRIGVAVSGGGDSIALLLLLAALSADSNITVEAITVDHGLREGSAEEAEFVQQTCKGLSVPHAIARWGAWNKSGNLQAAARDARYRLIAEWAQRRELDVVCIGHTQDDVAETFLMRLGRESGVDGLARMQSGFERNGVQFLRPLLDVSRESLRTYLRGKEQTWREDPSNENDAFGRVRARRALRVLDDIGLSSAALAQVAGNMADAKVTLQQATSRFAQPAVVEDAGDLLIDPATFRLETVELRRRLLSAMLVWMVPSDYPPRRSALAELDAAILDQRTFSIGGCLVFSKAKEIRVTREFNAVRDLIEHSPNWDRWIISGPWQVGMEVRALGEPALAGLENWRDTGLKRQTLMASPSVWYDGQLVAAPLAGSYDGWQATLKSANFHESLSSA